MSGLEAAITVTSPDGCPIAEASAETETPINAVTRSTTATDGTVVEEFEVESDLDDGEMIEVFGDDDHTVYRFERNVGAGCVCDSVEKHGCPVVDIRSEDGKLRVAFRPDDLETLRTIIDELREGFGGVHLQHLVESPAVSDRDPVVVDRGVLTDRQREMLETAYEMGYFEYPKGANAEEVAAAVGISSATLRDHLAAAQSKLLNAILDA